MSPERPALLRLLLRGVAPLTLGIGAVGAIGVGVGLALTVGMTIGLAGDLAVIVGFAFLYCAGVVVQEVNRSDLRSGALVFHGPAIDADPAECFFVAPANGRAKPSQLPPYVRRSLTDDFLTGLDDGQFVILTGKRESGMSRLIFETACESKRIVLVSKRMGVPSEDPLMRLMRDPGGFDSDEPQILYLRDFTSRLIAGSITTEFLRDWLARHPGVSIVVTLDPADAERIKANGAEAEDELEGLKGLASVLRLAPTLRGEELVEAREKFPELEEEEREWLPSYLVSADPLRIRFNDGDGRDGETPGRAIARAVADWQRAGSGRPAPEDYVRKVVSRYPGGASDGDFDAGLAWATAPVVGRCVALLYAIENEDGVVGYEVDDVILATLDDRETGAEPTPLPDFVWGAVIAELTAGAGIESDAGDRQVAEALLGVGESAIARGRGKVADRVLRKAARHGNDHQHQRIVQILSAGVGLGSASQSLVNSRRGDGVVQRLRAVEDLAQARKEHAKHPLSVRGASPTATFAWIYRRRVMRTFVRLFVLCLFDAFSAAFGLAVGLGLRALIGGDLDWGALAVTFGKSVALWSAIAVFAFALVRLYKQDAPRARLGAIVLAMAAMSGIGLVATLADGFDPFAALMAAFWGGLGAAWIDYRLRVKYDDVSRSWVKDHGLQTRTLVIGTAKQAKMVERALPNLSRPTVVIGYLSSSGGWSSSPHCLGTVEDLAKVAHNHRVGRILIADPEMSPVRRQQLADRCHLRGLLVEALATLPDIRAGGAEGVAGQSLVLVPLLPLWQSDPGFYAKRALDIVLALSGIALLSPLLIVLSLITWVKSGQIVTRSWRPGLGGSVFGMYRFPTTPKDAASPGDPSDPDGDPARSVTGFGAWMRNRGLDELPQLFNVLLGQMSFVGPRPLRIADHSKLEGEQLLRYVVRPGVTSPWQLCSPPTLTHAELISLDIAYLRHWSVLADLEILVKTARFMLRGRTSLPRLVDEGDLGTESIVWPVTHKTKEAKHRGWWRSRRR